MASTGQTRKQIRDEWDLPLLRAWYAYQADHPPLQAMVAAYLGTKPRTSSQLSPSGAEERLEGEAAAAFLMSHEAFAHR